MGEGVRNPVLLAQRRDEGTQPLEADVVAVRAEVARLDDLTPRHVEVPQRLRTQDGVVSRRPGRVPLEPALEGLRWNVQLCSRLDRGHDGSIQEHDPTHVAPPAARHV